jgi:hypothetical protein
MEKYKREFNNLPDDEQERLKPTRNIALIDDIIGMDKRIREVINSTKSNSDVVTIDSNYNIKLENGSYALFKGDKSCGKYGKFSDVLASYYIIVIKKGAYSSLNDILEYQKKIFDLVGKFC